MQEIVCKQPYVVLNLWFMPFFSLLSELPDYNIGLSNLVVTYFFYECSLSFLNPTDEKLKLGYLRALELPNFLVAYPKSVTTPDWRWDFFAQKNELILFDAQEKGILEMLI